MGKYFNKLNIIIILIIISVIIILLFTTYINKRESVVQINNLTIVNEKGLYNHEAENQSNFIVILTNQSLKKTKINLKVYVDGSELINQRCNTENQHTGYYYYYNLVGTHDIKITSDDGKEAKEEITFNKNKPRWVMASYWSAEEGVKMNILDSPFLWN